MKEERVPKNPFIWIAVCTVSYKGQPCNMEKTTVEIAQNIHKMELAARRFATKRWQTAVHDT
jgi:hypothetical protein